MDMQTPQDENDLSLETNIKLKDSNLPSWEGRIIRVGLAVLLLVGAVGYKIFLDLNQPIVEPEQVVEKSATVDTFVAEFADIRPIVQVYGQTVSGKQLNLRSNVGGEVLQISANFKSGALVDEGELLFTIDPFNYEGALLSAQNNYADTLTNIEELKLRTKSDEISLSTAKEQLVSAEKDYTRGETLRKGGTITSKALDDKLLVVSQRKQAVDLSQNTIQAQKSQMKRYETGLKNIQWSIDKAQRDLDHTKVYATFDSYVQNGSLQLGQLVGANEQVATLIDRGQMDIVFTLSDSLYGRILAQDGTLIGRDVKLIWQAGSTTQTFTATIDRVAAQITASSGGIELFAHINDLENIATLRVGSFMTVEIPDRIFKNVLEVPEHLIFDGDTVYVLETKQVVVESEDETEADKVLEEPAEPKMETRLRPIKISIIGYDKKSALVVSANDENPIKDGDVVLATKLSTAGDGVLVLTRAEAEIKRLARIKLLEQEKTKSDTLEAAETSEKVGE